MGKNMFRMWTKETFLRVRFVEHRDALMQILASLNRDKNSSVGIASVLLLRQEESEEWLMVDFVSHEGYQSGLQVRRDLRSDLFYFFYWMTNWTCQWKKQTESAGASEISTCDMKEASLKKSIFASITPSSTLMQIHHLNPIDGSNRSEIIKCSPV